MNNKIELLENKLHRFENVESVVDKSDEYTKRLRIMFKNRRGISIIQGKYTYGGEDGLFEIAPLNKHGNLDGSILNIEGDDVIGYLTEEQVREYAKIISEKS